MKKIENILMGNYSNHILPFLWQKGESHLIIGETLEKISESGIQEVCLESRPHPDFCGEQWWRDLDFIIKKCKELDMKIWILDDSHFPTGYANGRIQQFPVHRKKVLKPRFFDVIGPQIDVSIRLLNVFDSEEEFLGAVAVQDKTIIDLTNKVDGDLLTFSLGEGHWKICVLFISKQTDVNPDYINMIDKDSCNLLLEAVYKPHYERYKAEFGKTIRGFFSDEPGFMNEKGINNDSLIGKIMPLPWSMALQERLISTWSVNLVECLASLWIDLPTSPMNRYQYMDHVTALYQECFDENIGQWCREHNVMHIGHVIEDKGAHSRLGVGAGHFFRSMSGQDMAGVDIVINQLVPGMDHGWHSYGNGRGEWDMEFFNYALAKLGSSLAYVDPLKKGRSVAEIFGAFGWHEGIKMMKWMADHFIVRGINNFVPHAFSQAEFPDKDCPPHFYARGNNPQFPYLKKLMTYMNQMSTLFSDGTPHATAAILYHAEAEWTGNYMSIQKPARELMRNQIDFHFIPADVFSQQDKYGTKITDKGLFVNEVNYSCFVLPYSEYISKEVSSFLAEAKMNNFPVYILESLPSGLYDSNESIEYLNTIPVISLDKLVETLHANKLYDIKTSDYQPWLRHFHYSHDKEHYHLFTNEHPKKTIRTVIEELSGLSVDLLNNSTKQFNGELLLEPYESVIIIPGEYPEHSKSKAISSATVEKEISGIWVISYCEAKAYPNFEQGVRVSELTNLSREIYRDRTGIFKYEIMFDTDIDLTECILQIEDAYEIVKAKVNGSDIGVRICPPYRFENFSLPRGEHMLELEVVNTLDKAVTDMFSLSEVIEPSGIIGKVILSGVNAPGNLR